MKQMITSWGKPPVVICTYGPSGIGKTVDDGYSFPHALFVAAPGALNSIASVCGYSPKQAQVSDLNAATELINTVSGHFNTVVFDDFSFLAQQTFSILEKKYSGFQMWGELRDSALRFRDTSRHAGVNVILNCWLQEPKIRHDGSRMRGGPMLSGKLPEQIPALCDVVLRAVHEPKNKPWPAVYRCGSDPNYVMKDRFHTAAEADPAPMNLAEILRVTGHDVTRLHKGQEKEVAAVSQDLSGSAQTDGKALNEIYKLLLGTGESVETVRWTLRDAFDRAVLRNAKELAQTNFFSNTSTLL